MHIRLRSAAFVTLATLAFGGAAYAGPTTTITGTATFSDNTKGGGLFVQDTGVGANGGTFSISGLTVGGSAKTYSDFLTLCTEIIYGSSSQSDSISVTLSIKTPWTGAGTLDGTISEVTGRYNSESGSVAWNDPLTIALSNGDDLVVNLADTTLKSSRSCGSYDLCGQVSATFALTDPPPPVTPVPEPASMALLGAGVLGLGLTRWRGGKRA